MEKIDKDLNLLSEDQLGEVHGGSEVGGKTKYKANCDLCDWNSGWSSNSENIKGLIAAHRKATGHQSFSQVGTTESSGLGGLGEAVTCL